MPPKWQFGSDAGLDVFFAGILNVTTTTSFITLLEAWTTQKIS
jgi:hypothetical protein